MACSKELYFQHVENGRQISVLAVSDVGSHSPPILGTMPCHTQRELLTWNRAFRYCCKDKWKVTTQYILLPFLWTVLYVQKCRIWGVSVFLPKEFCYTFVIRISHKIIHLKTFQNKIDEKVVWMCEWDGIYGGWDGGGGVTCECLVGWTSDVYFCEWVVEKRWVLGWVLVSLLALDAEVHTEYTQKAQFASRIKSTTQ